MYDTVVALNQPSVDKFESRVKEGGNLIYDSANILNPPTRTDITSFLCKEVKKPQTTKYKSIEYGYARAFLKKTNCVAVENIHKA
jgi:2-oxoglutarate ferredoxin oxidoreductase subunit gamma